MWISFRERSAKLFFALPTKAMPENNAPEPLQCLTTRDCLFPETPGFFEDAGGRRKCNSVPPTFRLLVLATPHSASAILRNARRVNKGAVAPQPSPSSS